MNIQNYFFTRIKSVLYTMRGMYGKISNVQWHHKLILD